jgi:low affinity Fe/Cu permease
VNVIRRAITRLGVYAMARHSHLGDGFMTLVIQRAEHRDTQAIHAKLDEMLHAMGDARNELTRLDEEEPEAIEKKREHMRKDD